MTEKKNTRFAGVLKNLKGSTVGAEPPAETVSPAAPASSSVKTGRPPGKKSNPEYSQVTVYLRKGIHQTAKKFLIDDEKEFSELVDVLVSNWIAERQKSER